MKYKGLPLLDDSDDSVQNPVFRLRRGSSDTPAQDGEIWYRSDLNEIKSRINGQTRTLFDNQGMPPPPPPTVRQAGTVVRTTSDSSGVQGVNVGFRPSTVYLIAADDSALGNFSNGWTTGTSHSCVSAVAANLAKCVSVVGLAGSWNATAGMSDVGFDLIWTKVGQGLNVTVSYLAIK